MPILSSSIHSSSKNTTDIQLLNRQVAAVNFKPLKPLFQQCYTSAHVSVPANPSLPPLTYNIRRNPDITEMREVLPAIAFSLDDIRDNELAEANRFFSRGKFVESLAAFRAIIQKLLLVVAKDESEATDVSPTFTLPSSCHLAI